MNEAIENCRDRCSCRFDAGYRDISRRSSRVTASPSHRKRNKRFVANPVECSSLFMHPKVGRIFILPSVAFLVSRCKRNSLKRLSETQPRWHRSPSLSLSLSRRLRCNQSSLLSPSPFFILSVSLRSVRATRKGAESREPSIRRMRVRTNRREKEKEKERKSERRKADDMPRSRVHESS